MLLGFLKTDQIPGGHGFISLLWCHEEEGIEIFKSQLLEFWTSVPKCTGSNWQSLCLVVHWTYLCYSIPPVLETALTFMPVSVCARMYVFGFNWVNRTGWFVTLGTWPTLFVGLIYLLMCKNHVYMLLSLFYSIPWPFMDLSPFLSWFVVNEQPSES